jgi:hypothetical protein
MPASVGLPSPTRNHGCWHLRPRPLLGGAEECPSGALLALVGEGGLTVVIGEAFSLFVLHKNFMTDFF